MRKYIIFTILFSFLLLFSSCQDEQIINTNPAQAKLDEIYNKYVDHKVDYVEVLCFHESVMTSIAVSPSDLEKNFHYKLTIRLYAVSSDQIMIGLKNLKVTPPIVKVRDVRWGLIFYDYTGRIGSIYLVRGGSRGFINDMPVEFDGYLYNVLKSNFNEVFHP